MITLHHVFEQTVMRKPVALRKTTLNREMYAFERKKSLLNHEPESTQGLDKGLNLHYFLLFTSPWVLQLQCHRRNTNPRPWGSGLHLRGQRQ